MNMKGSFFVWLRNINCPFLCFLLHPIVMLVIRGMISPLNMGRSPSFFIPTQTFWGVLVASGCHLDFFLLRDTTTGSGTGTFLRHSLEHPSEKIRFHLSYSETRILRSISLTAILINLHFFIYSVLGTFKLITTNVRRLHRTRRGR